VPKPEPVFVWPRIQLQGFFASLGKRRDLLPKPLGLRWSATSLPPVAGMPAGGGTNIHPMQGRAFSVRSRFIRAGGSTRSACWWICRQPERPRHDASVGRVDRTQGGRSQELES
jgi:hypothetical protein